MIIKSKKEKAQGLAEYAIILALVSVVSMGIMSAMGPRVGNTFSHINDSLQDRGIRLVLESDDDDEDQSTSTPIPEPTATPTLQPTSTPIPQPTPTATPQPTAAPTEDGCTVLREAYIAAVAAYQACDGGFWRCRSEYNAVVSTYFALRNAGCE